jgi:ParB family chromosome partitioning protein
MTITAPEARTADGLRYRDIGEFAYLDPRKLVLDPYNVRTEDTEPDQAMLDSVEEDGVEVPLIVRPQEDGNYGVLAGQIRMLSAQEAVKRCIEDGRPEDITAVPVMIRHDLVGQGPEVIAAAVAKSLRENHLRRGMSAMDTTRAFAQLGLLGLGDPALKRVAKSAGVSVAEIEAALRTVAMAPETQQAAMEYEFDLQQLADLAEVEEVPGALEDLAEARRDDVYEGTKDNGNWAHTMAQLRQQKQEDAAKAELRKQWTAAGLAELPRWYTNAGDKQMQVARLFDAEGQPIDYDRHNADCPGRAFAIRSDDEVTVVFFCADWKANGHHLNAPQANSPDTAAYLANSSAPAPAQQAGPSPHEVGLLNKEEQAAREVREKFIKTLIAGKLSDAAVALTLNIQTDMPHWYRHAIDPSSRPVLARYLDVPMPKGISSVGRKFFEAVNGRFRKARRASNIAFAQVAMAFEHSMSGKKSWATPDEDQVTWLRFLQSEGYTLSKIEKMMVATWDKKAKERLALEKKRAADKKAREAKAKKEAADKVKEEARATAALTEEAAVEALEETTAQDEQPQAAEDPSVQPAPEEAELVAGQTEGELEEDEASATVQE